MARTDAVSTSPPMGCIAPARRTLITVSYEAKRSFCRPDADLATSLRSTLSERDLLVVNSAHLCQQLGSAARGPAPGAGAGDGLRGLLEAAVIGWAMVHAGSEPGHGGHWFAVTHKAAAAIEDARRAGGRIIAIGRAALQAVEAAASADAWAIVRAHSGRTHLQVGPGRSPRVVSVLLTGLHSAGSDGRAAVEALVGRGLTDVTYQDAADHGYLPGSSDALHLLLGPRP